MKALIIIWCLTVSILSVLTLGYEPHLARHQVSILANQVDQLEPILINCLDPSKRFFPLGPKKKIYTCWIKESSLTYDQVGLDKDGDLKRF